MAEGKPKLIVLTGSPLASALTWSENNLNAPLLGAFAKQNGSKLDNLPPSSEQSVAPQWRILQLEQGHLPTGLTQPSFVEPLNPDQHFDGDDEGSFATDSSSLSQSLITNATSLEKDRLVFYEHSFTIHETADLQSSGDFTSNASSLDDTFSTSLESPIGDARQDPEAVMSRARLNRSNPSSLKDMPTARHLRAISPQTMTVDLVIGVISISQPRSITTRRNQRVQLVEMIVGDETSAGFLVNIWLDEGQQVSTGGGQRSHLNSGHETLRTQTSQIRPRDIVLARNVALGSFRERVSGQSLRKGVTTLDLLYRQVVDASDRRGLLRSREIEEEAACDAKMARVKRTKHWVTHFVGARARPNHFGRDVESSSVSMLPEDTQKFE